MDSSLPRRALGALLGLALMVGAAAPTHGQGRSGEGGLPVPRYVSLRSDDVNLRAGPGARYPVDWVFKRRNLPVEVVAEFEHWRRIRDWQGTEGWVHQSMLSARRYVMVAATMGELRRQPERAGEVVARAETGVLAQLIECRDIWCRVDAAGHRGWVERKALWGVYPDETVK